MFMFEQHVDTNTGKQHSQEFAYWRKHHDLHGFFEQQWQNAGNPGIEKGDKTPVFNCIKFTLTKDILLGCIDAIKNDKLPPTTGFFFGDGDYYDPAVWGGNTQAVEQKQSDINIFKQAIQRLDDGVHIYYDSWW